MLSGSRRLPSHHGSVKTKLSLPAISLVESLFEEVVEGV